MKIASLLLVLLLTICAFAAMAGADGLSFSLPSGFYAEPQTLTISCDITDAVVRYTTTGAAPTAGSAEFSTPIELPLTTDQADTLSHIKGTHVEDQYVCAVDFPSAIVVRAAAFLPDGSMAAETCGTYFIGYDRQKLYGNLPVISLMMDSRDLFDAERGIYVLGHAYDEWLEARGGEPFEAWQVHGNFSERGKDWERPVMVDFMLAEDDVFCQAMGVRIKGATSRTGQQKSLRLIARKEYGEKSIQHDLFPGNVQEISGEPVTRYKSVVLRNGGNDRTHGKIRDPFISELARGMHLDIAENRFVIAFINGEYWGLYALNEEYSDNYIQYHYGLDDKNIVMVKNGELESGEEEDLALYTELLETVLEADPEDPDDYAVLCDMLDMDSLADYLALTLYIDNRDDIFDANNFEMWRVREPGDAPCADGKWRVMLFDTDYSSGIYTSGEDYYNDTLKLRLNDYSISDESPAWLVLMLLDNEDFRQKAVTAMCDVRNLYFDRDRMKELLSDWRGAYLPYIKDTFLRFGPEWVARWSLDAHPAACVDSIAVFFSGRYDYFPEFIQEQFELDAPKTVTIRAASEDGHIYLNHRSVPAADQTEVRYFAEYPLTATAVAEEGKTFAGWEINGDAELDDASAETVTISFFGPFTLTAHFN